MFTFATTIWAIDPLDGKIKKWAGPNIKAISKQAVRQILDCNGLGYCEVGDMIHSEIDQQTGEVDEYNIWN